jgi:hypothetical protein
MIKTSYRDLSARKLSLQGLLQEERKGRGEADRWGPHVSERKQKEKERGDAGWRG